MNQKDNTGALFENDRKETEKHPDLTGSGMMNGQEVWLSGWRNVSQNGKPYIKVTFKTKEPRPAQTVPENLDDEVPF